jgi:hypothetical protein
LFFRYCGPGVKGVGEIVGTGTLFGICGVVGMRVRAPDGGGDVGMRVRAPDGGDVVGMRVRAPDGGELGYTVGVGIEIGFNCCIAVGDSDAKLNDFTSRRLSPNIQLISLK